MQQTLLKPTIHWLAIFIPVSFALAYIPAFKNQLALFGCSCLAMIVVGSIPVWKKALTRKIEAMDERQLQASSSSYAST